MVLALPCPAHMVLILFVQVLNLSLKPCCFYEEVLFSAKLRVLMLMSGFSAGPRKAREVYRHFGKAPGTPHSHTK